MSIDEPALAATETEARAAFVSRAGGPALDGSALLDRAARALPGVLSAGADVGTALTGLAAYAARGPAPEAWALDLVTGALRRAPGAPAGDRVGVAAGLTWLGALESGLAAHCEALIAERLARPGTRVPRLRPHRVGLGGEAGGPAAPPVRDAEPARAVPQALLRALRTRGEPVAHDLSGLLSLPACAVRLVPDRATVAGGRADAAPDTVVATGPTLAAAVRTASERALCLNTARPGGSSGLHTIPPITGAQEDTTARRSARPQWSHPLDALRSQGLTPAAVLLDHDARLDEVLPYVVRIVLSPR
ncbi:hypothetical protein [Streptomyces sp. NBC_00083]|uniref:hypothetical protein n=1 Tax=Streptomyces sp. NBC_00083 TaxID=2975647 RepID=UPI00225BC996|nr:hypothetical protein [Streptomyces sp. NBC_00083]MCX5387039.1 hypothetical protein [Streptomyces sp. NBC_00083]